MVITQGIRKDLQLGTSKLVVLKDINLEIPKAKFVVLCGPSGSGKTTLLNIIGGIDRPTKGKIIVAGQDLTEQDEDFLSDFRCNNVGFVFQAYNLVSTLTVAENVAFPMEWTQKPSERSRKTGHGIAENCGFRAPGKPFSFATKRWRTATCRFCPGIS